MSKILLINHYAGSPEMGMEFRPYYFSREWTRLGHEVHIIASDFSHLRRKNPEVNRDWQIENIDGIYYHWIQAGEYQGNGAKRAISMERFVRKIIRNGEMIVKLIAPDIIICSSTYPLDTFAGQRLKKLTKNKAILVHEVHDMWPETLVEIGGMSRVHPFVAAMQVAENSAYKHSDKIVAMMPYSKNYMVEHGMAPDKWIHIPLGIDVSEWENKALLNEEHTNNIKDIKRNGYNIIGYFGGHAISNALGVLIAAAEESQRRGDNSFYVLVGDGVEKQNIINAANDRGLRNITFLPPVPKNEVPALLKMFDAIYIGTLTSPMDREFGICMNKMADSMMSGKPVISAVDAPGTWVEAAGSGITVEAEDIEGIVDGIEELMQLSEEERNAMGLKGREYCKENLDVRILAKKMLDFIME